MEFLIPMILFWIVSQGLAEKIKVYDEFIYGAKRGMRTVAGIAPTLIGLMTAVSILRASGFLDLFSKVLGIVTEGIGFPAQLMPIAIVRMFSSSAAVGLVLDIFKNYGTDSRLGLMASIMMSCTESIFYTMSVYFMSVEVRKTRFTLPGALLATLAGIAASVVLTDLIL